MDAHGEFEKKSEALLREAERRLPGASDDTGTPADEAAPRLLHDLRVHQIELELQNEELRETQRALEQSRDRYLELYHRAPVGYVVADAVGMVLEANQTFGQLVDRDLGEIVRKPLIRTIHMDDQGVFLSQYKAFYNHPAQKRLEVRMVRRDRAVLHVRLEGRRTNRSAFADGGRNLQERLLIAVSDITAQKMAEQAIIRAKTQWEQTFDAVPDLIAIINDQSEVVRVNRALAARLGLSPQACVGRKCYHLLHAGSTPPADCPHARFLADGRPSASERFNRKLNGHFIQTVSPFKGDDQESPWSIHLFHDITDRKRAEREQLKGRNLESIGTLAGGIAHDFNNILTALVGNIELAKLHVHDPDQRHAYLDSALEACFRARDLANRLLTFSKGGLPAIHPVRVDRILQETVHERLSGTPVTWELKVDDRLAPIVVDEGQIRTALQNIIDNAREAMPRGGTLSICAQVVEVRPGGPEPIPPGSYLRMTIADQGCGIGPAHLDKIFDPYFTTKPMGSQKGMGLGLAISHSIVKRHHGHIAVHSVAGEGTTVTIDLPLVSSLDGPVQTDALQVGGGRHPHPRILVMDDERMLWEVIRPALAGIHCETDFVADGRAAVDRYTASLRNGHPYALLILDLTIPGGMGGKETIGHLRALDPDVKAVVSSGYSNDPVFADYRRFGFVGALKKPFQIETLKEYVAQLLGDSAPRPPTG